MNKCLNVVLVVIKFIIKTFSGHQKCEATIDAAERVLVRQTQKQVFSNELRFWRNITVKAPPIVKQFNLFTDGNEMVRCRGRVDRSELS